MLTLAIETSNPSATASDAAGGPATGQSVAFGRLRPDGGVTHLGQEPVAPATRHDDDLLPAIDRLARRLAIAPEAIERIAVSVGPGGFTAVRVAVASAVLLAEANTARGRACQCIAVPSALVAAWNADASPAGVGIAVALASKGDTVHLTSLRAGWRERPSEAPAGTIVTAAALAPLAASGIRTLVADRHLPEAFRRATVEAGLSVMAPHFSARACLDLASRLPALDPSGLLPVYPREPEAVTLWRARGK